MPTENQLELRRKHIGATDSAAILGLSPYRTAYDIWLEKTGKLDKPFVENESMAIGKMCEDGLIEWAAEEKRLKVVRNQFRVHPDSILSATHDALVQGEPVGIEAKTAGIVCAFSARDKWGEDGSDEIPEHYLIQCQHQCVVSGLELVFVPALIGGRGRAMFSVARNEDLCNTILERCTQFWARNVLADIPPDGVPTLEVAKYIKRNSEMTACDIPASLVQAWQSAKARQRAAEQESDAAQAAILAAMGANRLGLCEAGAVKVSQVESTTIDTKAMRAAHPDIVNQFEKAKVYDRVSFKAAK